nr:cyclin-Y-like protein 2 [Saimiri boliviensis boliviensis]
MLKAVAVTKVEERPITRSYRPDGPANGERPAGNKRGDRGNPRTMFLKLAYHEVAVFAAALRALKCCPRMTRKRKTLEIRELTSNPANSRVHTWPRSCRGAQNPSSDLQTNVPYLLALYQQVFTEHFIQKCSSCSTIFLDDSTASRPHFTMTLKSVALVIYYLIRQRGADKTLDVFDERSYPFTREQLPEEHFKYDPRHKVIFRFVRTLFKAKKLRAELAIVSLVYIKRLIRYADLDICPTNWKRIILGAILLALKVRSEEAVCLEDYCELFENLTVEDMNELEEYFVELINYNFIVPGKVYTRYYFCLRALAHKHGLRLPVYLLERERAWELQAFSRMEGDEVFSTAHKNRSLSADDLIRLQRSKAILS